MLNYENTISFEQHKAECMYQLNVHLQVVLGEEGRRCTGTWPVDVASLLQLFDVTHHVGWALSGVMGTSVMGMADEGEWEGGYSEVVPASDMVGYNADRDIPATNGLKAY